MVTRGVTRRRLLEGLAGSPAGLLVPWRAWARGAAAEAPVRLGLVLLRRHAAAEQARLGAEAGLREGSAFAGLFGRSLVLLVEEAADIEEAARKGADLVLKGKAAALLGGLEAADALALGQVVARADALFLNVGSRADALRAAACHRWMLHVQPSDSMYLDALSRWLVGRRKAGRWVVLAADTPRGEALRRAAAAALVRGGGEVAAQERLAGGGEGARLGALRRAARHGGDGLLLAADSETQLAVARAAARAGLEIPLAGPGLEPGEFLSPDLRGVAGFWSTLWYHEWRRFSAGELNRRFRAGSGAPMQGVGWAAWASVRLVAEAAVRAGATAPTAIRAFLTRGYPFDGHKGVPLTFRPRDQQLRVTFGVVSPRAPGGAGGPADVYDTHADDIPHDPSALDSPPSAHGCRLGT